MKGLFRDETGGFMRPLNKADMSPVEVIEESESLEIVWCVYSIQVKVAKRKAGGIIHS